MRFLEEASGIMHRITVAAAIAAVCHKVLGGGNNPHALEVFHKADPHARRKAGIFAIGFFHPAPTHIRSQIYHRRKNLTDAAAGGFAGNGSRHTAHQRGIERSSQGNGLGESCSSATHQSVQSLIKNNNRNTQTCFLNKIALNAIDFLHCLGRCQFRVILQHLTHLRVGRTHGGNLETKDSIFKTFFASIQITRHHINLPEFFFHGHSLQ